MKAIYISLFALLVSSAPFIACAQDTQESVPTPVVTGVIAGAGTVTVGSTEALVDTNEGGMWNSSNNAIATVSKHGIVTGIAAGTVTISYAYADANFSLVIDVATVTVNSTATGVNTEDRKACIGEPLLLDITPSLWGTDDAAIFGLNVSFASLLNNANVTPRSFHTCANLGYVAR